MNHVNGGYANAARLDVSMLTPRPGFGPAKEGTLPRIRLIDIAERVGVSAKTVSNVVNGQGMVSDEKREEILQVIRELGYRPNLAARQLRTGTSGMVAIGLPDLREPYFAEFASAFCIAAEERGLAVVVRQTHGDREVERAFAESEGLPALEGIVLSPLSLTSRDLSARRSNAPLVLIGEHGHTIAMEEVPHVGVDNVAAAAAATRLLLERGRRRVAVIGAQKKGSTATSRLRLKGYRRALADFGIPFNPDLVGHVGDFNRAEGSAAAAALLASGTNFDGLFCFNDTLAFGALYSLVEHRVAVPDDVAVVGFDAIEEGRYSLPTFATIDPNSAKVSEVILDAIAGSESVPFAAGRFTVPFSIEERAAFSPRVAVKTKA